MRLLTKICVVIFVLVGLSFAFSQMQTSEPPDNALVDVVLLDKDGKYVFQLPNSYISYPVLDQKYEELQLEIRLRPGKFVAEKYVKWRLGTDDISKKMSYEDKLENYLSISLKAGNEYAAYKKQQRIFPEILRDKLELTSMYGLTFLGLSDRQRKGFPADHLVGRRWYLQDGQIIEGSSPVNSYYVYPESTRPKGFFIRCVLEDLPVNGKCVLTKDIFDDLYVEISFYSRNLGRWREIDNRVTQLILGSMTLPKEYGLWPEE
ncbi:hypothetical protein [Emcibacter sp.]|uniref:hypothetical protein n=1 Tax=Emcibacter sp. TaxID=1979954 RepID=UPI002AA6B0B5|nr:hypothetical protein [Emcibacter sp.]